MSNIKGFKTFDREGLVIGVGQEAKVDVIMQPGEQTQTVTVTEAIPLVETTSATLTGNIDTQKIADLPLNGRNFVNLLTLRPGFVNSPGRRRRQPVRHGPAARRQHVPDRRSEHL